MTFGAWLDLMWRTNIQMITPQLGLIEGGLTLLAMVLILGLNHFTVRRGLAQAALYTIMVIGWYGLKLYVLGDQTNVGAALLSTVFTFQLTFAVVVANLVAALIVWLAPGPTVRVRRSLAGVLHRAAAHLETDAEKTVHEKRAEVIEIARAVIEKSSN